MVVSQGAWSCQRAVRFDNYIAIKSYHDGLHAFPEWMLFDVKNDPHEQHDLAPREPRLVEKSLAMLDQWHAEMMRTATHPSDPMWTVMREGGPYHTCGNLTAYLKRLRETGRTKAADALQSKHASECAGL